ncbi:MAG TPA: hypothetical protein VMV29_19230 [Ktedonobacterales bacterium]|nr:hypothetical protein [Ktedonobacterales bacterium]
MTMTSGAVGATKQDPFDFFRPEYSQNPYPFYQVGARQRSGPLGRLGGCG